MTNNLLSVTFVVNVYYHSKYFYVVLEILWNVIQIVVIICFITGNEWMGKQEKME